MKQILFVLGVLALSFAALDRASAQTITAGGSQVISASTPAPGSSTDYAFGVGSAADDAPNDLTNFTLGAGTGAGYQEVLTNDSYATAPGGSVEFETAIYGSFLNAATTPTVATNPFLTFTLDQASTETSFNVYVLTSNNGGAPYPELALSTDSSNPSALTSQTFLAGTDEDEYVKFTVTDATPGESFYVYGYSGPAGNFSEVGGITFENAPEPGTTTLMACGVAGLALLVRRRRQTLAQL